MDETRHLIKRKGVWNMAIPEEEKKKRREMLETNFNIIGSGFGGEVNPEVKNQPYWEQYIKGDITLEELNKAVHNDIASN